jgi:hypothetical protein
MSRRGLAFGLQGTQQLNDLLAVCESRLPVGSSASKSSGEFIKARAIATRCCSPPDNSKGLCSNRSPNPTRPKKTRARASTVEAVSRRAGWEGTRSPAHPAPAAGISLKDKSNPPVPKRVQIQPSGQIAAPKTDPPLVWRVQSTQQVEERALPGAGSPAQGDKFTARHLQLTPRSTSKRRVPIR